MANKKVGMIVLSAIGLLALGVIGPLFTIWSINAVCGRTVIPLSWGTFFAVLWLGFLWSQRTSVKHK